MKIAHIKKLNKAAVVVLTQLFESKKTARHYPAVAIDLFDMVRDEKMKLIEKGISKKRFKKLMKF